MSSPSAFSTTGLDCGFMTISPSAHSRNISLGSVSFSLSEPDASERFRDLLLQNELPKRLTRDFENLLNMFETMSDALRVEMLPPNLGEVLPESLSPSDLSLVHFVSYEAMTFLDGIRTNMHKELDKIRDIFALGLPDLRQVMALPDLATACRVWRNRLMSVTLSQVFTVR
jgi:hypothetical protein